MTLLELVLKNLHFKRQFKMFWSNQKSKKKNSQKFRHPQLFPGSLHSVSIVKNNSQILLVVQEVTVDLNNLFKRKKEFKEQVVKI